LSTTTHASSTPSTAPKTTASAAANPTPVEFFEQNARNVWKSRLSAKEKATKLNSISDSIEKYLEKAQVQLDQRASSQDDWTHLACGRATAYLQTLANDVKQLAMECQQKSRRGDA
jgi:hypothetical protein